jgi:heat shock protein HslJ
LDVRVRVVAVVAQAPRATAVAVVVGIDAVAVRIAVPVGIGVPVAGDVVVIGSGGAATPARQQCAQNPAGQVVSQQQPVIVTEAEAQNPLAGTRWQVTAFGFGPVIPGTTLTMAFSADGAANGSSGCNTYSATYLVNGNQLSITPPIGTGMMCAEPAGIMEQEQAFLALLPAVGGFTVEGSTLRLLDGSGQAVAELVAY